MSNTIVVSDLEGLSLDKIKVSNVDLDAPESIPLDNYIICGDVIDSTMINETPELTKAKSFNIQNILAISTNTNIRLALGNRDLNKIKLILLGQLKTVEENSTPYYLDQFNKGTLKFEQYQDFKSSTIKLKWDTSITEFPLFWFNNKDYSYPDITSTQETDNFFYNRFLQVFGDSMGALYLLDTIWLELRNLSLLEEKNEFNPDKKAFIVFLVFNRMLSLPVDTPAVAPVVASAVDTPAVDTPAVASVVATPVVASVVATPAVTLSLDDFNGILIKLYKTSSICFSQLISDKLYIFSHGGIQLEMLDGINYNFQNILFNVGFSREDLNSLNLLPQNEDIISYYQSQVDKINNYYRLALNKLLELLQGGYSTNKENKKNIKKLIDFLLTLCAPAKCTENSNVAKPNSICQNNTSMDTVKISPIISGLREMKKSYYNATKNSSVAEKESVKIILVFGHHPFGYSGTAAIFGDKLFIVLDTSNSFNSTNKSSGLTTNPQLIIPYSSEEPYIKTDVAFSSSAQIYKKSESLFSNLKLSADDIDPTNFKEWLKVNFGLDNSTQATQLIKIKFKYTEHYDKLNTINTLNRGNKYFSINLHSIQVDKYYFTINPTGFYDDNGTLKYEYKATFQNIFCIFSTEEFTNFIREPSSQLGGGGVNYKNKYLKYKKKYLLLKNF